MAEKRHFDIAVVGGGPAGIVAAIHAARGGRKVCLIDRKKSAGSPVRCGEAIGLKGFSSSVSLKQEWIKSRISCMKLVSPSNITVTVPNSYEGYIVDREKMESDLTRDAVALGAEFFPGTSIMSVRPDNNGGYLCESQGITFASQCVILAEGVESRLGRGLGWTTVLDRGDIHSCAFARVAHDNVEPGACVFYLGSRRAPGGYIWVFHRGGNTANVGLGVIGARCNAGMPRTLLEEFIKEKFPGAQVSDMHCGGVPMAHWIRPLVRGGVMLAGDAAHMMNCVSGAGIAYALYSGKTAGTVAAESFAEGKCRRESLKNYQDQWASFYGKQQDRSYAIKEAMIGFPDAFLDDVARAVTRKGARSMNILSIFIRAFYKRPLLLMKVIPLLK
jgi:digeranylgeranylglycerophospholipid reductase